ncbi:type II toxin-antitoxin system RelE/ParE family toxin [Nisaea acidiphila]|uniref:Toxin n=1 Tax=Nisaea acidiphila TaxID=1862145 RepID=A0A9J7ATF8_9PROT|nr:type II toxin-antitoxin system RelE/ParE family toxin [Nisaea acidiphila]UUX49612.1 type II toxin-antitoxin system RelE/ParE family toxin [Nisaea acidiphila]
MPGYRVSQKAKDDIREIGRYTEAEWGRAQRRLYLSGMELSFRRLAENPQLAALRPEYSPPVRIQRYEKHLIVYVEQAYGILIVRVLYESMDVPSRLGGT